MSNSFSEKDIKYFEEKIADFKNRVSDLKCDIEYPDLRDFQMLTAAVHSYVKQGDFTSIVLKNAEGVSPEVEIVVDNLADNFGIHDDDSAQFNIGKACFRGCYWQFLQFDAYDNGQYKDEFPKMSPKGQETFLKSKEFSDALKPLTVKGYLPWDVALSIDILKESLFCDYFNEPTADKLMQDIIGPLLKLYSNWPDFAVDFILGGTYSAYKNADFSIEEARSSFDSLLEVALKLFEDEACNVWKVYGWYKKKDYFPTLDKDNLKVLLKTEQGCFVSDRISIDGAAPCLIYREEPFKNFPDSGWRFFAGDESKEYSSNIKNSNIFPLNVMANFDESIIPLLDAEVNTAFIRKQGEDFIEFKTMSDAMKSNEKKN
ncbi:MAG: DUF2185 domain-containing protein [Firmicutes bacterium]|nr:DUF2185 domain-containing protein [Bacillota bacterium]